MALYRYLVFTVLVAVWPLSIFAANPVDINTASLKELDNLTGVGPALAQRIIDGRPYYSLDGLLEVKGIGQATLEKIREQGLAYVSLQMQQQAPKPTPAPLPKSEKSVTNISKEKSPAAFFQPTNNTPSYDPAILFFTSGGLLVIGALAYTVWHLSKAPPRI